MGKKKNKKNKQKNRGSSTANGATSKDLEMPIGADDQPKVLLYP